MTPATMIPALVAQFAGAGIVAWAKWIVLFVALAAIVWLFVRWAFPEFSPPAPFIKMFWIVVAALFVLFLIGLLFGGAFPGF